MFPWLIILSLFPYLLFPCIFYGDKLPANTEQVRQTILFLANAHIAATLYLYFDKGFVSVLSKNRGRYIVAPIVATLLSGLSYALTPDGWSFLWFGIYMLWQNWHFGKQTFGVYSVVSLDQTPGKSVTKTERSLITATIIAGALGALSFTTVGVKGWHEAAVQIRNICAATTLILFLAGLGYLAFNRDKFNLNRALFFSFLFCFFPRNISIPHRKSGSPHTR